MERMELKEAMQARHSVRQYTARAIEETVRRELEGEIEACNREGRLHIQAVWDEPKAFDCTRAHYGKFSGVTNYIVLVGKKSDTLDERCGYYGERIALKAQQLGLNTCWVAMTYRKVPNAFTVGAGERVTVVLALGYGQTSGAAHKSKSAEQVSNVGADTPPWFRAGVEAALLAPTAMNQQKFRFTYADGQVQCKAGFGFYTKVDLGIARYHFEIGSDRCLNPR